MPQVNLDPAIPEFLLWITGHPINETVMASVAQGLKDPIRHTSLYQGILKNSVSYGILRGNQQIFNDCHDKGVDYFEIDRGYFKPNHFNGYYRVSLNDMQPVYRELDAPDNRFKALRIQVQPWQEQKGSGRILVAPPTDAVCKFYHIDGDRWLQEVKDKLKNYRLKIRAKTDEQPLNDDIDYSECVVTYNSNVAIDALIRGVPAIATSHHSVIKEWSHLDIDDVSNYNKLTCHSREKLFNYLAYCQWTLSELSKPATWRLIYNIQKGF